MPCPGPSFCPALPQGSSDSILQLPYAVPTPIFPHLCFLGLIIHCPWMLSRPTKEVRTRGTADFCRRNAMVGETKGPLHLASQQWVLRKGLSATRWRFPRHRSNTSCLMNIMFPQKNKTKIKTTTKIEATYRQ